MKPRFTTKEDAIQYYTNALDFTKGELVILYKAIVGHAPKKGKSKVDMQDTIEREINTYRRTN